MTKYNIHNPATARRVIYSGLDGANSPIGIGPDERLYGVELSDVVAEDLMLRNEQDPRNELRLTIAEDEAPVEDNGQQGDRNPAMKMTVIDEKIEVVKAKGKR